MRAPYANIPRDNITPFSNTHSEKHDLFSSRGTCYYESYLACVLCWDGSCNSAPSECGVLSYVLLSYRGTCYYESYLACVLCWDIITCLDLNASCRARDKRGPASRSRTSRSRTWMSCTRCDTRAWRATIFVGFPRTRLLRIEHHACDAGNVTVVVELIVAGAKIKRDWRVKRPTLHKQLRGKVAKMLLNRGYYNLRVLSDFEWFEL